MREVLKKVNKHKIIAKYLIRYPKFDKKNKNDYWPTPDLDQNKLIWTPALKLRLLPGSKYLLPNAFTNTDEL